MTSIAIHQYYYLWSVALVIPLWVLIFFLKKESRVEILYMGILLGTSAMGLDRYCSFYDYWQPPTIFKTVNFESFLYGFFWGGISTKIYELMFNKEYCSTKEPNSVLVFVLVFISFFLYMALLGFFNINSVDIYIILLLLWVVILIFFRRKFFAMSILSGIGMVLVNLCWYTVILIIYPEAIDNIWLIGNLSGLSIFNVPIEEHFYIFFLGCFGSIMYKVATIAELRPRRQ